MRGKGLLFGLAGLLLGGGLLTVPAHADTLPSQYQGTWYGYISSEKIHHVRHYYFSKITIKPARIAFDYQTTTNGHFKNLKWTWGASSLATYKAKKDKKSRQIYKIYLPVEEDDAVAKIRLGTVTGTGSSKQVLILNEGYENLYLFRQPLRSHPWGIGYEDSLELYD
ncbi:hypothetical protein [Levilactobacillus sp. N40-8-2]|uniref:hypothetical protein n=1 Tax=Levilactobacillus muriae TaxID=3238987 RepID=UPI0038B38123